MANTEPIDENAREELIAYLDGELDKKSARAVEAKLSLDAGARQEADTLRRTWELLDFLPRPEPSPNFTHRTMERITALTVAVGQGPQQRGRRWLVGAGWAAAILVAASLGFAGMTYLMLRHRDQELVRNFHVIDNMRLYENVDDIDFLHKLANPNDPDLFGDDSLGS